MVKVHPTLKLILTFLMETYNFIFYITEDDEILIRQSSVKVQKLNYVNVKFTADVDIEIWKEKLFSMEAAAAVVHPAGDTLVSMIPNTKVSISYIYIVCI